MTTPTHLRAQAAETLPQELARLVHDYNVICGAGNRAEAWNLIADFSVENATAIISALTDHDLLTALLACLPGK